MRRKNHLQKKGVDKLCFRLFEPYTLLIEEQARAAGISPNQFGRIAAMAMADSGLLGLKDALREVKRELEKLREDFNEAVE